MSEQKTYQIQMTEFSENSINVSYISEEEYIRVKIDELLPSEEEGGEMLKEANYDWDWHDDIAYKKGQDDIINHIKSKLTEKGE